MPEDIQSVLVDIRERLVRVETKIDDIQGLRDKVENTSHMAKTTSDKVEALVDNQKWIWRSFAGAIIVSIATWLMGLKR